MLRIIKTAAVILLAVGSAYPCTWAVGHFHQVTALRGQIVGTNRGWPRFVRLRIARGNVRLRLFEYRWPIKQLSDMRLVATVTTDSHGRFDFPNLKRGHYTLVIDWPEERANWFDVEVTALPKPTSDVTIDATGVYPDCTGGHEFISR